VSAPKPKLSLDLDYDTLVKLFGGPEEIAIKLREGIIQTFAEKHLKGVNFGHQIANLATPLIEQEVHAQVSAYMTKFAADVAAAKQAQWDLEL
jgi:hypothetical protein